MVEPVPEKCKLPPKTGMCRAYFRRWFYNATSGACERFVYGGCQANANNFRKKEQCEEACVPAPCPDITKCPWCEHGLAKDERGCTVCECAVNPCSVNSQTHNRWLKRGCQSTTCVMMVYCLRHLRLVTLLSSEQCSQFEQHCPLQDGLYKAG